MGQRRTTVVCRTTGRVSYHGSGVGPWFGGRTTGRVSYHGSGVIPQFGCRTTVWVSCYCSCVIPLVGCRATVRVSYIPLVGCRTTVLAKLVDKIIRGHFVDMDELLRDNLEVQRRGSGAGCLHSPAEEGPKGNPRSAELGPTLRYVHSGGG